MEKQISLSSFQVIVLRAPISEPVRTAFGIMRDRPLVLIGITDSEGITGWGEVWCNFPSCGAEHRARLFQSEVAPLLVNKAFQHPSECFYFLSNELHLLVNQSGESGPIAQVIAGVDIACWDLYTQHLGQPLFKALATELNKSAEQPQASPQIQVYASGLNPTKPENRVREKLAAGYKNFKLKVGFDDALDARNAETIRDVIGKDGQLMLDANQSWDLLQAKNMISQLADSDPLWIEEPLPVDAREDDWLALSRMSNIALAGGENFRGDEAFTSAIESTVYRFVQPDIAKWGGLSGNLTVVKKIHDSGLTYCPHWLGGGVGLMASAHLLAAAGGNGLLEVDANPNPLRDELLRTRDDNPLFNSDDQTQSWQPRNDAGIGVQLDQNVIARYSVFDWQSA